jgi:UDP-N-acetylglucosamine acyltransferase
MNSSVLCKNVGTGNYFESNVFIAENVIIGSNNKFLNGTIIHNNVVIGDNNLFSNYSIVGSLGEMGLKGDIIPADGKVEIGNNNKIREFVVIGFPAKTFLTKIGDNNYFMARSHIPHDCIIGNNVVMAPNSVLGGVTQVEDYVFIGLGSSTHHGKKLGEGSMIAMQSANNKSVPPFMTVAGVPSKIKKLNRVGAERRGIDKFFLDEIEANLQEILNLNYFNPDNSIIVKIQDFIQKNDCILEIQ